MCAKEFRNVPVHRLPGAAPSIPCNQMSDTHKQTRQSFACTSLMISEGTAAIQLHWKQSQSKRRETAQNRCWNATAPFKLTCELWLADANTTHDKSEIPRSTFVMCPAGGRPTSRTSQLRCLAANLSSRFDFKLQADGPCVMEYGIARRTMMPATYAYVRVCADSGIREAVLMGLKLLCWHLCSPGIPENASRVGSDGLLWLAFDPSLWQYMHAPPRAGPMVHRARCSKCAQQCIHTCVALSGRHISSMQFR